MEKAKNVGGALRRLMEYLAPYKAVLILAIMLAAAGAGIALLTPYLLGQAIDRLAAKDLSGLIRPTLLMLGAYVISAAAQISQGVLLARIAQKAMRTMRNDLFTHLQRLSLRFFDSRAQGDLLSRLTNDLDSVSRVLTDHASQLFTGILTLVGVLGCMFYLNIWLALGSMVVFPAMAGLVGIMGRRTRAAFRDYQMRLGILNAVLEENFSGQRVVMAYGRQDSVLSRFDEVNKAAKKSGEKAMSRALLAVPMMGVLANANVAILGGLGGWMAVKGLVTIGTITAFISYSRRFAEPLRQLGGLYNQVQAALAGAERTFEILDMTPDLNDAPQALDLPRVRGDVVFDHVTFSYAQGVPVLNDISLNARPGETIALVGHTGAGKTTIVNLLSRFYDIDSGTIRIDGFDISQVARDSLRRQLGVVLQQSFLFKETVRENIRYGRLDAGDEEVYEAARLAHADGFIRRLPQGYDTVLSEQGANLSGGQRQLITIARAILADPAILILDEATSSVDTRTEVNIQKALQTLMAGRTSFVIAHRLSTISSADRVLVLEKGRIVEQGTHDELMGMRGVYHRLTMSQYRGAVSPEAG